MTESFGPGRLFLTDARLAFALLNHARYGALERAFGTTREQANAMTFVIALGALEVSSQAAKRVFRFPRLDGTNAAMGGFMVREAALGIAGPVNRRVPMFGTLVAAALVARLGLPGVRRVAHHLRQTEARLRTERIQRYLAAERR
jgi:hypothetical protein